MNWFMQSRFSSWTHFGSMSHWNWNWRLRLHEWQDADYCHLLGNSPNFLLSSCLLLLRRSEHRYGLDV